MCDELCQNCNHLDTAQREAVQAFNAGLKVIRHAVRLAAYGFCGKDSSKCRSASAGSRKGWFT